MRLSIVGRGTVACATGAWISLLLSVPVGARAEGRWCEWSADSLAALNGSLLCYEDGGCDATDRCPVPGQADRICIAGECVPPCSTIRLCDTSADCASMGGTCTTLLGAPPPIFPTPSAAPAGVCVSSATTSGSPFPPPAALCRPTWGQWEGAYRYRRRVDGLGDIAVHAASWTHGDADLDGCPNAADSQTCTAGGPCATDAPQPPSTCPDASAAGCCTVSADGLALTCGNEPGSCGCSTIDLCTPSPRPLDNPDCEDFHGGGGVCLRPRSSGALGVCFQPAFVDHCSDLTVLAIDACFRTPDGAYTDDFHAGDCDRDGCPNGQDDDVCVACDGALCRTESRDRPECTLLVNPGTPDPPFCAPDAGVGADAGAAPDAGETLDASAEAPPDAGPPVAFGGAGCRCRAGGNGAASERSRGSLAGLALALIATLGARRRRSRAVSSS